MHLTRCICYFPLANSAISLPSARSIPRATRRTIRRVESLEATKREPCFLLKRIANPRRVSRSDGRKRVQFIRRWQESVTKIPRDIVSYNTIQPANSRIPSCFAMFCTDKRGHSCTEEKGPGICGYNCTVLEVLCDGHSFV